MQQTGEDAYGRDVCLPAQNTSLAVHESAEFLSIWQWVEELQDSPPVVVSPGPHVIGLFL